MKRQQLTKGTLPLGCRWSEGKAGVQWWQKGHWESADYQDPHKFSSSSCSALLKFPMLNHLEIPDLFFNLLCFARSLVQTNHKTDTSCQKYILTTFIRFSWSPFWFLAFFSLNEKGTWIFTTNYANIQMPIIHRTYTPAGNRTMIQDNIENGITENYYRKWLWSLCKNTIKAEWW